jgi:hypothetical protein
VHADSLPETTAVPLGPSFFGRDYDDVVSRCGRCVGGRRVPHLVLDVLFRHG